jgi:DNA-binding CsgD family transcriptional regulator
MDTHRSGQVLLSLLFFGIAGLVGTDVFTDLSSGVSLAHVLVEIGILACSIAGLTVVLTRNFRFLNLKLKEYERELDRVLEESRHWKEEADHLISGLSAAIDQQFERWRLTASEREVALLMLKGLSLKEVARTRHVSERTARQQSISVYKKTGLAGRAELSAFFLEDLFLPIQER